MNIAVFSDSYYPYISGVVRSIELFRQELQKLGHNVYIFAPSYYRQGEEEGVFRFPSVTAPTNKGFSLALPFAPGAGKMIRELKIDLIHCHSPFPWQRGRPHSQAANLPLVFTTTPFTTFISTMCRCFRPGPEAGAGYVRKFCNNCNLVITPTSIVAGG